MPSSNEARKPTPDELISCAERNRVNLSLFAGDFERAVQLFELLERGGGPPSVGVFGGIFIQYRTIAAKEGAMNIYHFGSSLQSFRRVIALIPSEISMYNPIKIREAWKLFEKSFPNFENTRHAIAHAGEIHKNPGSTKMHTQKKDYKSSGFSSSAGGILSQALYERTYSVSWKGEIFNVHMTLDTIAKLGAVIAMVNLGVGRQA